MSYGGVDNPNLDWVSGIKQLPSAAQRFPNGGVSSWYQHHSPISLSHSLAEQEQNRQRCLAVYKQQQQRQQQGFEDDVSAWRVISSIRASSGYAASEAIRKHGLEQHVSMVMRPTLLMELADGEAQHAAVQAAAYAGKRMW
jgi:hypothetical protein